MKLALVVAATGVLASVPAAAQVIVDVGTAGIASAGPGVQMNPGWTTANDFTLASTETIRAASFYSLECCTLPWEGALTYLFFSPDATLPFYPASSPFVQATVPAYLATEVYSDAATNVVRRFDFNLVAPLTLGPGTYFFALQATTPPGSGPLAWRAEPVGLSANTPSPTYDFWWLQGAEPAFQLLGSPFAITAAPEPGTVALLGGGLLLLAGAARGRRRRA